MGKPFTSKVDDVNVTSTPPETVGSVTVETQDKSTEKGKKSLIRVKGKVKNELVQAWENDERHPEGQAWVCGDGKEVSVYPTPYILRLIADGTLERAN